ncbi:hypothetical protein Scep_019907 [Stephania cephalantha]|uniref:Uncharacterized protein n=1 Tax=Stephania cephalantha TaxID=152367 RepID=A0AAP0NMM2_9MAGN
MAEKEMREPTPLAMTRGVGPQGVRFRSRASSRGVSPRIQKGTSLTASPTKPPAQPQPPPEILEEDDLNDVPPRCPIRPDVGRGGPLRAASNCLQHPRQARPLSDLDQTWMMNGWDLYDHIECYTTLTSGMKAMITKSK